MQIETLHTPWQTSHATNSTASSFASKVPTITEPTGDGVIDLGKGGTTCPNGLMLVPYGVGSDNDAFDMRVIGWRRLPGGDGQGTTKTLWVPVLLGGFSVTVGASVGVAGGALGATAHFADTITLKTNEGTANVSNEIVSPVQDLVAHVVIDAKGAEKVEIVFDQTTGTPTMACLVARL